MPRLRQLQTNFASGELDPLMHFRVDTGAFKNGARRLRNAILYNSGGAGRRPGTRYASTLVGNTRLVPFEFASDERYLLPTTSTSTRSCLPATTPARAEAISRAEAVSMTASPPQENKP